MPYVRVSLMQAKPNRQDEVNSLLDDLGGFFAGQPGFIEGYGLHASDGLVGRITVWETAASADAAAQHDHVLAVRSRLNIDVVDGSHQEHAFEGKRFTPAAAV